MPAIKGSKWSEEAKAKLKAKLATKKVKHVEASVLGDSTVSPPTVVPEAPGVPDTQNPIASFPSLTPEAKTDKVDEKDTSTPGPEGKDISKDKKEKPKVIDAAAVMEMAPGLVKLAADGVGTGLEIFSNLDAVPVKGHYNAITNETAEAFCKANRVILERYLPGWYKDWPLAMVMISFGAMITASMDWQKKPPKVKPQPHVEYNNRAVEQVIVRQPVPEVQNLPNPTAAAGGIQHGV